MSKYVTCDKCKERYLKADDWDYEGPPMHECPGTAEERLAALEKRVAKLEGRAARAKWKA